MNDKSTKDNLRAFKLKGSFLTVTILEITKPDTAAIQAQFMSLIKQTPDLFRQMPIIIDISKVNQAAKPIDLVQIKDLLIKAALVPIGLRGGNAGYNQAAREAGLGVLADVREEKTKLTTPKESLLYSKAATQKSAEKNNPEMPEAHALNAPLPVCAKLITQPVRSGQQIYAKEGDLIILASVSPGAEVLAEGNIHVYGALRGRALAGVSGNRQARIFCRKLDAELISIAGHYRVNEELNEKLPEHEIIQIYLDNDRLKIEVI